MSIALDALADLFGALSHPDRLRLLLELQSGERGVQELAEAVGISQPRASQHLALLRAHHLVTPRREQRRVYYALTHPELLPWLAEAGAWMVQDAQQAQSLGAELKALAQRLTSRIRGQEEG